MENKPNNANQETKSVGLLNAPGLQHSCVKASTYGPLSESQKIE